MIRSRILSLLQAAIFLEDFPITIYPLVGLCLVFCLGIITAAGLKITFTVFCVLCLAVLAGAVFFLKKRTACNIFILMAAFFLGAALLKYTRILPANHIYRTAGHGIKYISLTGAVDSEPIFLGDEVSFVIKVEKTAQKDVWQIATGRILVKCKRGQLAGEIDDLSFGDRLLLKGTCAMPYSFSREFNYREYLKRQSIYSILRINQDGRVKRLHRNSGNKIRSFAYRIKHFLRKPLEKNLSAFSANIFSALLLGDRQNLSTRLNDVLMKSGTIHIIAISGFNIGIVVFVVMLMLKIIRTPRKMRYIATMIFLPLYCVLAGANPPVVRATIMSMVFLSAYLIKRQVNVYNSLAISAFIILAINPWQLFEISFQLSYLSIICIAYLSPKIAGIFPERLCKIRFFNFLILTFSVSLSAWLGLLPLTAYYFRIITPIALFANMIIVPYASLIVMMGFALVFIGIFNSVTASFFAAGCELSIVLLFKICKLLIMLPGAYFNLPQISPAGLILYYFLLISVFTRWPRRFSLTGAR